MADNKMVGLIFRLACILILMWGCGENRQKIIASLEESCLEGRSKACLSLASFYTQQEASPISRLKTLKALQKACEYGDLESCGIVVRVLYAQNRFNEAMEWLNQGCEWGEPKSCFVLAQEYLRGKYAEKDWRRASRFLVKACYGGEKLACKRGIEILERFSPDSLEIQGLQKQLGLNQWDN